MKVGIFYISQVDLGGEYTPFCGGKVFIRCDEIEAEDLGEALDLAAPRQHESVMNTHEIPVEVRS